MRSSRRRPSAVAAALAILSLLLAGCGGNGGDGAGERSEGPAATTDDGGTTGDTAAGGQGSSGGNQGAPQQQADLSQAKAQLVAVADLDRPTAMAVRANDDGIYVTEKSGRVRLVPRGQTADPGPVEGTPVLDLSGQVSSGSEQGLLGLTFSPDGSKLYVNYTDTAGDTRVVEYDFAGGRADVSSRRELLMVDQPFANHNGGQVSFGPDGKLYIGMGDGGSREDPGNRAQNLGTLLGKILRIDPRPSGDLPYTVPSDNPFVGRDGARGEIWAYGLRNPWRFSWDRVTKDLWIADVGQDRLEEIDFLPPAAQAGANLGWPLLEGTRELKGDNPSGAVLPIFEYGRSDGCSVTGGFVYRGKAVPGLAGVYVYGDACTGTVWGLIQNGGQVADQGELDLGGGNGGGPSGFSISSFGEDAAGDLYLLNLGGNLFRFAPA